MSTVTFSRREKEDIQKYFGKSLGDLKPEDFENRYKELRTKYHPDKFEKHDDEVVRELATAKFQEIERLGEKIRQFIGGAKVKKDMEEDLFDADAVFAFEKMRIEIVTKDKDLKYKLFRTIYKYLERGDRQYIPGTNASIIIDESHINNRVGFLESVKMYLTFGPEDNLDDIVDWLLARIQDSTFSLIIEGKKTAVNFHSIRLAIKKRALVEIGSGE